LQGSAVTFSGAMQNSFWIPHTKTIKVASF